MPAQTLRYPNNNNASGGISIKHMAVSNIFYKVLLKTAGLAFLSFSIAVQFASAAPNDLAPISEELFKSVMKNRFKGSKSLDAQALAQQLESTAKLLKVLKRKVNKNEFLNAAELGMLEGKWLELGNTKLDIWNHFAKTRYQLEELGLSKKVKAWNKKQDKVEKYFLKLQLALKAITQARNRKEQVRAITTAINTLSTLRNKFNNNRVPHDPKPPYMSFSPKPTTKKPSKEKAPAPKYLSSLPFKPIMYAMLEGVIISDVPTPVTPVEASSCDFTPGDLAETADVKITPEIKKLARELKYSPAKIYEYVNNQISFSPYQGSLKGSQGTLISGVANTTDQSSLLIALLRASKIPARYVKGVVEFKNDNRLTNWLGVKSLRAASTSLRVNQIPTVFSGNAIEFSHVWVEACVPYGNYRGEGVEKYGFRWIPFDASFNQFEYQNGIATNVVFDTENYLSTRTDVLPHERYAELVEQSVKSIHPNNQLQDVPFTGKLIPSKFDILPATLPYKVKYYTPWETGGSAETAALPATHAYNLHLSLRDRSGNLVAPELTLYAPDVLLERITLSYKAATPEDKILFDSWTGNFDDLYTYDLVYVGQVFSSIIGLNVVVDASNVEDIVKVLNENYGYNITPTILVPGSVVNVLPVIKVNGVEKLVGTEALNLGDYVSLDMQLAHGERTDGKSGTCLFNNNINSEILKPTCFLFGRATNRAGSYAALQFYANQASDKYLQQRVRRLLQATNGESTDIDETLGEFLHLVQAKYSRYANDARAFIAEYQDLERTHYFSLGTTSSSVSVQSLFDLPFGIFANRLLIDIRARLGTYFDITTGSGSLTNDKVLEARRLGLLAGSALEHYIWQENAHIDAISTVRGLQYANEIGIPVITFDSTNIEDYDALTAPSIADLKQTITSIVADGGTVTTPAREFTYSNPQSNATWNGTVYLAENRLTGAGGAFISGNLGGGEALYFTLDAQNTSPTQSFFNYTSESDTSLTEIFNGVDLTGIGIDFTISNGLFNEEHTAFVNGEINQSEFSNNIKIIDSLAASFNGNSGPLGLGDNPFVNMTGDPVNVATGNMIHSEQDISIDGRGLPLVFERFYNSLKPKDGPLGYGWTHSFNHQLVFLDNNYNNITDAADTDELTSVAAWVDATGGIKTFGVTADASGVTAGTQMTNPDGYYLQASRSADGTYTLKEKNGLTYTFENVAGTLGQTAKLMSIRDRNNNTLTMNYTGENLTSVTDDLNRSLILEYNIDSRIKEVRDWAGRTYQYNYDNNGDLVEYKNPLAVAGQQTSTTYTYYDGLPLSHAMQTHVKPNGNSMTFEYYSNRKVFRHYNELDETMTFTYNIFRGETVVINERGYSTQYFFDKNGSPTKMIDENGGLTTYTYNDPNNIYNTSEKRDALGYKTQYEYDADGNLIKQTNPSGSTVEYSYFNQFSQAQKVKDANGNYTIYKFNGQGNRTDTIRFNKGIGSNIDPTLYTPIANDIIAWTIATYDAYGNPLTVKQVRDFNSRDGPTVTYDYNDIANGTDGLNVVKQTRTGDKDGDGIIGADEFDSADLTYDNLGRTLQGVDNWYSTQTEYDELGRVISQTDQYGHPRDIKYDANNNVIGQKLVQNGNLLDQSSAIFDVADRRTSSTNSGGFTSYYTYDEVGNVVQTTNPDNYTIGFEYDGNSNIIKAFDAEGNAVTRTYDLTGKVRTETDPNGNTTTYEYYGPEQEGRLYRQYDALNRYTEFDYDSNGNVIRVTDNLGRSTLSQYDSLNRVIRVVGPVLTQFNIRQVTTYRYDNLGNRTQVFAGGTTDTTGLDSASDSVTLQMTSQYDDFGRVIKQIDPRNRSWTKQYDSYGNLVQSTDAKNQTTSFTYNYGGQLATRTDHSGNVTTITYNELGQPLTTSSANVTYSYRYDSAHRQVSMVDSRGNKQMDYDYSPGGLLNYKIDNEGNQTDYLYDPVGRLSGIWAPNGDLVTYVYDAGGRLTEKWLPNGVDMQLSYNADNTLANVLNTANGNEISRHDYSYDAIGQRENLTETINNNTKNYKYLYDELNRLTEVQDNGTATPIESYGYDIYNNRESRTTATGTEVYLHDAAQQLKEIRQDTTDGSVIASFNYDDNGNMNQKFEGGVTTLLSHDALNRVSQVSQSGKQTQWYAYDQGNRRLQKKVGTATTNYLYEGNNIVGEYGTDWTLANAIYTHGAGSDSPISRDVDGLAGYYHQDGINSVVGMTNMVGDVSGSARYDAFGNTLEKTGNVPLYGYTGREPDETGLIYYRARYYDPRIGRFTQADPAGFIDGINRYTYAVNNPVNFRDPSGLSVSGENADGTNFGYQAWSYTLGAGNSSSAASVFTGERIDVAAADTVSGISTYIAGYDRNDQRARFANINAMESRLRNIGWDGSSEIFFTMRRPLGGILYDNVGGWDDIVNFEYVHEQVFYFDSATGWHDVGFNSDGIMQDVVNIYGTGPNTLESLSDYRFSGNIYNGTPQFNPDFFSSSLYELNGWNCQNFCEVVRGH